MSVLEYSEMEKNLIVLPVDSEHALNQGLHVASFLFLLFFLHQESMCQSSC